MRLQLPRTVATWMSQAIPMRRLCSSGVVISSFEAHISTCRPIFGIDDEAQREVRISCPDATGLGCDVTRMLLDFGLKVLHGDMTTDGRWCFLIFKAGPSAWWLPRVSNCCNSSPVSLSHACLLQVPEAGYCQGILKHAWCLPLASCFNASMVFILRCPSQPSLCAKCRASSSVTSPRLAGKQCGPLASPCMPTALP